MLHKRRKDASGDGTLDWALLHQDVSELSLDVQELTATSGLVSATSSGAFRYLDLSKFAIGKGENDSEGIPLDEATDEQLDAASYKWTVPGPLHQVTFFSATSDTPTHFAYGGEQVPLSLWSITAAIQHVKEPKTTENGGDASKVQENTESAANQGKRKKASGGKHRELLPGELWRAKNVRRSRVTQETDAISFQMTVCRFRDTH